MLLIVEIALTVFAWRAGWKALALLPLGIGIGCGFVFGVFMGMTGNEDLLPALFIGDVGVIAALVIMATKGRKASTTSAPTTLTPEVPAVPAAA